MEDSDKDQDKEKKYELIIDVYKSQSPADFEANEMFFRNELKTALDQINGLVSRNPERSYQPVTIFGQRGAGKTSFLLALRKTLENSQQNKDKSQRLCILDTLDPLRIEENEIFFVTVIASIMRKVREQQQNYEQAYHQRDEQKLRGLHTLNDALDKLAKTFNVLIPYSGITGRDRNESSIGFADRVLADSLSGLTVRKDFAEFIQSALSICKCKAFLITIDEIDVAHHRCTEILETIRKYLDIQGLAVVVAIDEELLDIHLTRDHYNWMRHLLV